MIGYLLFLLLIVVILGVKVKVIIGPPGVGSFAGRPSPVIVTTN
jgi:hypothetical protein